MSINKTIFLWTHALAGSDVILIKLVKEDRVLNRHHLHIWVIQLHVAVVHQPELQSVTSKHCGLHLNLYSYHPLYLVSQLNLCWYWSLVCRGQFDKRVECFIPPCYSEVNYRCNQFHATLRWFYDDGEENGGLHFYLSELYIIITVRSLWSWLNLTVSSMFIKWDNWNSEWSTSRDNARIRPKC